MIGGWWVPALALLLVGTAIAATELDQVRAQPNLEKRSKLALDNAASALKEAREAYRSGDLTAAQAKADEIADSVDLAYSSLTETGKNPRKSPRWFKHAEMETRALSRKLEDFAQEMSYNDRPLLEKVRMRVDQVHDNLLTGLMEGKKK